MAGNRSGALGGDRSPRRLPCPLPGLSSSPILHPGIVSDVQGRLSSGSSLAARGRGDACQRSLRNRPRSLPGFYSRLFLVENASGGWRPVIDLSHLNEIVQLTRFKMETVASVLLSVREGDFLASLDLKDAYFQIPIHRSSRKLLRFMSEGDGLPVTSPVFWTVDRSPGLRQGLRGCISMGTLSWDQTSPLSGRLVGSLLLGAESQAGRPVAPLTLSHPRDCDKREEVGSRALADCEVSRHDHRYQGRQGFSVSGASREIPNSCVELLYHGRSPSSALAGDLRSPGFARAAGSSWSPSDAHFTMASEGALVPRFRPSLSSSALATGSETGPVLVDGEGSSLDGGSIWDACAGSSPVFRRVLFGMGRSPSQSTRVRGVVRPGEVAAHQSSRNDVIGHHVTAMCDNSMVVAYVNKQGGTVSRALCLLASRLLRWTESFNIHLDARYLPGQANVLADVAGK